MVVGSPGSLVFVDEQDFMDNLPSLVGDYVSQEVAVYETDEGIGPYEYWGMKGTDVSLVPQCDNSSGDMELVWTQASAPDLRSIPIGPLVDKGDGRIKHEVDLTTYVSRNVKYIEGAGDYCGDEIPVDVKVEYELKEITVRVLKKDDANTYWCRSTVGWEVVEIQWR